MKADYTITLGGVEKGNISVGLSYFSYNTTDDNLKNLINSAQQNGIFALEAGKMEKGRRETIKKKVTSESKLFPIALRDWIQSHGYTLERTDKKLDADIQALMEKFKNGGELTKNFDLRILDQWQSLSYLEKTLLKDSLEKILHDRKI